ncbi:hypothetical protein [Tunicatimonas pelagia]|uniref:hypothetical protein n=1 Tax=Tunicatimonas pelagia TaxID=931531 RepID=UPI0026659238|nr:hypothetical protein [Tunicatimonas pelagia]WKN42469.1 hypothetical protein P0M28_25880 [Tunicatimonas pelagia]
MRRLTIILLLACFTLACREDKEGSGVFLLKEGTYTGIFYRTSPNARWATANITVTLEGGRFSGSSEMEKYPAICEGTYQTTVSNQVTFSNNCVWTADFDWTFILEGEFQITERDQKLILTREYEGEVVDTYELTIE